MKNEIKIKKELLFNEFIWYENGNYIEWIDGLISNKDDHYKKICNLEEAFKIAEKLKAILIIQPEYQNQCIFADFTNEGDIYE
jgi:hypothetical protein